MFKKAPIPERGKEQAWVTGYVVAFEWPAIPSDVEPDVIETLRDAVLDLPQAREFDGPFINGVAAVTFEVGELGREELIRQVVETVRGFSAPKTPP